MDILISKSILILWLLPSLPLSAGSNGLPLHPHHILLAGGPALWAAAKSFHTDNSRTWSTFGVALFAHTIILGGGVPMSSCTYRGASSHPFHTLTHPSLSTLSWNWISKRVSSTPCRITWLTGGTCGPGIPRIIYCHHKNGSQIYSCFYSSFKQPLIICHAYSWPRASSGTILLTFILPKGL